MRGNVVDMAVGVIIGGAFGKIVSSFLNDVMMPPLGILTGGVDFSEHKLTLKAAENGAKAVTVNYGNFITTIVDFTIMALAVFLLVKGMNTLKRSDPVPEPNEKQCPECLMNVPIHAKRCGHCSQPISV